MLNIYVNTWENYNENGADGGDWLSLPMDKEELQEALQNISDAMNDRDPEYFINDYEWIADIDTVVNENDSIIELNDLLNELDQLDIFSQDIISAMLECYTNDLQEALEIFKNYECILYGGQDLQDVAYDIIDQCYNIPDGLENYIDYEAFARDLSFDGYYETSLGVLYIA